MKNCIKPFFLSGVMRMCRIWNWTTTPDEKKITSLIINDTIKAVKFISSKQVVIGSLPDIEFCNNCEAPLKPHEIKCGTCDGCEGQ